VVSTRRLISIGQGVRLRIAFPLTAPFESLFARDLNLLLGIFLLSSILVVVVNLIVDVIYSFLDPRIEVS